MLPYSTKGRACKTFGTDLCVCGDPVAFGQAERSCSGCPRGAFGKVRKPPAFLWKEPVVGACLPARDGVRQR